MPFLVVYAFIHTVAVKLSRDSACACRKWTCFHRDLIAVGTAERKKSRPRDPKRIIVVLAVVGLEVVEKK